jgi:hypothetical protein
VTDGRGLRLLWRGLFALTVVGTVGTAVELALERHWGSTVRLIPWLSIAVLVVGLCLVGRRPGAARLLAVVVVVTAGLGVYEHVDENHKAGPLDRRYSATWDTMSSASQWWAAATKAVGPAPPLAPAALAEAALGLLLLSLVPLERQSSSSTG